MYMYMYMYTYLYGLQKLFGASQALPRGSFKALAPSCSAVRPLQSPASRATAGPLSPST